MKLASLRSFHCPRLPFAFARTLGVPCSLASVPGLTMLHRRPPSRAYPNYSSPYPRGSSFIAFAAVYDFRSRFFRSPPRSFEWNRRKKPPVEFRDQFHPTAFFPKNCASAFSKRNDETPGKLWKLKATVFFDTIDRINNLFPTRSEIALESYVI